MIDQALWNKWRYDGNDLALQQLFERHGAMVFETCHRILNDAKEAREVGLKCFEVLMRDHGEQPAANMGLWLHSIAVNQSRLQLQQPLRKRRSFFGNFVMEVQVVARPDIDTVLDDAFEDLPEELRTLLMSTYFMTCTRQEVARSAGISRRKLLERVDEGIDRWQETLEMHGVIVAIPVLTSLLELIREQRAPKAFSSALDDMAASHGRASGRENADEPRRLLTPTSLSLCSMVLVILGVFGASTTGPPEQRTAPGEIKYMSTPGGPAVDYQYLEEMSQPLNITPEKSQHKVFSPRDVYDQVSTVGKQQRNS